MVAKAELLSLMIAAIAEVSIAVPYFMNQTNGTLNWCTLTNCLGNASYNLVVGQAVSFNVTAVNIQSRSSTVSIDAITDPGIPNGAQLSAPSVITVQVSSYRCFHFLRALTKDGFFLCTKCRRQANFLNATAVPKENWTVTYRTFTFTPQRRQEGLRYQVPRMTAPFSPLNDAARCILPRSRLFPRYSAVAPPLLLLSKCRIWHDPRVRSERSCRALVVATARLCACFFFTGMPRLRNGYGSAWPSCRPQRKHGEKEAQGSRVPPMERGVGEGRLAAYRGEDGREWRGAMGMAGRHGKIGRAHV